jgi:cytosine/adenosine deaminase-related metal-dependent hydrolase
MHQRLATGRRGIFGPAELIGALTGHAALGWPDAGRLEAGARADLVAVTLDPTAVPAQVVFAASTADIHTVVIEGRRIV